MLERLRICICHPKLIGSFYKDSFGKIIGMVLLMLSLVIGVFAVKTFCTDSFDSEDNQYITSLIIAGEEKTTSYDSTTKKMTGAAKYTSNSVVVYFCPTDKVNEAASGKIVVIFYEEYAEVYYSLIKLGSKNYSDLKNVENFELSKIRQGSIKNQMAFEEMLTQVLDSANVAFSGITLVAETIRTIGFFIILVLVLYFLSIMINPTITKMVRFKLTIYCCLVYLLAEMITIMTGFEWLEYVSIVIPSLYMFICMTHIVRVKKQ